jgi:hypothetical protein
MYAVLPKSWMYANLITTTKKPKKIRNANR